MLQKLLKNHLKNHVMPELCLSVPNGADSASDDI